MNRWQRNGLERDSIKVPGGHVSHPHPVDLANPGRPDRQRLQAVASQPRAALRAYHAGDRMASSPPRGALKRPAATQNLLQTDSSSAFLTHFLVSADDFKILLVYLLACTGANVLSPIYGALLRRPATSSPVGPASRICQQYLSIVGGALSQIRYAPPLPLRRLDTGQICAIISIVGGSAFLRPSNFWKEVMPMEISSTTCTVASPPVLE